MTRPERRRIGAGAISAMVGIAVLVVFMLQNTEQVRVHFLAWHFSWELWLLTLVTALVGAVAFAGVGAVRRYRRGR